MSNSVPDQEQVVQEQCIFAEKSMCPKEVQTEEMEVVEAISS
jgi:hypothetical protein